MLESAELPSHSENHVSCFLHSDHSMLGDAQHRLRSTPGHNQNVSNLQGIPSLCNVSVMNVAHQLAYQPAPQPHPQRLQQEP